MADSPRPVHVDPGPADQRAGPEGVAEAQVLQPAARWSWKSIRWMPTPSGAVTRRSCASSGQIVPPDMLQHRLAHHQVDRAVRDGGQRRRPADQQRRAAAEQRARSAQPVRSGAGRPAPAPPPPPRDRARARSARCRPGRRTRSAAPSPASTGAAHHHPRPARPPAPCAAGGPSPRPPAASRPAGAPSSLAGRSASKEGRARPKARAPAPWTPMAAQPQLEAELHPPRHRRAAGEPGRRRHDALGLAISSVRCSMGVPLLASSLPRRRPEGAQNTWSAIQPESAATGVTAEFAGPQR